MEKTIKVNPIRHGRDGEGAEGTAGEIKMLPVDSVRPFRGHPFRVEESADMDLLTESIRLEGVLTPVTVRKIRCGYELISGHRRLAACKRAGLEKIPAVIRDLDDDEAVIAMVDANLQREKILPGEKAFAYKMKLEAIKRRRAKSRQVGEKGETSVKKLSGNVPDSERQVQRFIRLTFLIKEILSMVDEGRMGVNPAVEVSFLKENEQKMLFSAMEYTQSTPSLSKAQRLKALSVNGTLDEAAIVSVLTEEKAAGSGGTFISEEDVRGFFPDRYSPADMRRVIISLLERWREARQRKKAPG